MPIDISLFRNEQTLATVRESQRRRHKPMEVIDSIVALDAEWRGLVFRRDNMRKEASASSKEVGAQKKAGKDTEALQESVRKLNTEIKEMEDKIDATEKERDRKLNTVGNLVPDDVPISNNEDENKIERTWGTPSRTGKELHHHQLLAMIDGVGFEQGVTCAGHRGYFLKGVGVMLNQALINFGLDILRARKYIALQPPFFMKKEIMAETAQLEEFDEALYHVKGEEGQDMYLIATSEQPISSYHRGENVQATELPIRYAGISSCFRKEAGSHGRDTWGIFRIHQFEKVEQFVLTEPDKSWEMHKEMIEVSEEFYQRLKIPYRVINIVSGALNNAAAKKLDLEAWFPTLAVYRELVSCSNCTDYQARAMETRFGQKSGAAGAKQEKQYVHMLNGTLTATERTMCCIVENYQCDEGVRVPECLQKYMGGMTLMPFVKECPINIGKHKADKAVAKKEANAAPAEAKPAAASPAPKAAAKADSKPAASPAPAAKADVKPAASPAPAAKADVKPAASPAPAAKEKPAAATPAPAKEAAKAATPAKEAAKPAAAKPAAASPAPKAATAKSPAKK